MGIAGWLDDFASKYHKKELTKKAGIQSEASLTDYIYKTNNILTHDQFQRVSTLISESNDFSDQKIADAISTIRDQDKAEIAKSNFDKLSQVHRDDSWNEKLNEINLFVQSSVSTGFSKNASLDASSSPKEPETFQEALGRCEDKLDYVLSSKEYVELQKFADRKRLGKKAMPEILSELENWIGLQKVARIGRSINNSNKIQTVKNQVEAGLESFKNLNDLSVKDEADNLRYLPGGYKSEKDAREDDVRRQVEQEHDTTKKIKKEKGVDRTMGLKTAAKEGEGEEKEVKYKLQAPANWDMPGTPKGFGEEQGKVPAGEGKKRVDKAVDAVDEIREKMEPVKSEIEELQKTLAQYRSEELAPLEKEEAQILQKLGRTIDRMDEADNVLIEHRDKMIALITKYNVEKKPSIGDFLQEKIEKEGLEDKLALWLKQWDDLEEPIKGIKNKFIKRFTKKSGLFVKAEEDLKQLMDELNDILDEVTDTSDMMIDTVSDFSFELDQSMEDTDEGEVEEEGEELEGDQEGIESLEEYEDEEIELPKAASLKKSAVRGKPNDTDKCRDCTYFNSGIGTTYYKCATCIHAYSEEELDAMGDDINELSDYFNDRGVTEVSDSASNYSKKHASLKQKAQQPEVEQQPAVAPPPVRTPVKTPERTPTTTPTRTPEPSPPPRRDPFDPFKTPSVTPAPNKNVINKNFIGKLGKFEKSAAYAEEVEPGIKKFWQEMPEGSVMSKHPLISKHGKELNEKAFDYISKKAPEYNPEEGVVGYMPKVVEALQKIIELEKGHKEQLEEMAKDIGVKIFGIDKSILDAKLESPSSGQQEPEEIEVAEMTPELEQQVNKRVTINALTHGSAAHIYLTAHHMIDEAIKEISPELLDLYNKFAGGTLKAYWLVNYYDQLAEQEKADQAGADAQMVEDAGVGEAHIEQDEEGNKKVVAEGIIFPALVHEVVKGIMELLSHQGLVGLKPEEQKAVYQQADTLKDEQWLLQIGSELWRRFNGIAQEFLKDIPEEETENFSLSHIVAMVNQQPPDIVNDFMEKVVNSPEEALQALHEITGVVKKEGEAYASGRGYPLSDKERLQRHETRFPEDDIEAEDDLPPRGTGLGRNFVDRRDRGRGNPKTNDERLERHKMRFPEEDIKSKEDLPPRGTGLSGYPRTNDERLRRHQFRFPEEDVESEENLPPRGTGFGRNSVSRKDRRSGNPKTNKERLDTHKQKFPKDKTKSVKDLPPRGTGLGRKLSDREDVKDKMPGGRADGMECSDIADIHNTTYEEIEKEKNKGKKVEREHTNDPDIAEEIAKDHLVESDEYYDELAKMEKKFSGGEKNPLRKKANGGETTSLYTVKSPGGEEVEVTPGQLAMSGGWVTDSKGNKFKPESFTAKSLEEKMSSHFNKFKKIASLSMRDVEAIDLEQTHYGDMSPEDEAKYKAYRKRIFAIPIQGSRKAKDYIVIKKLVNSAVKFNGYLETTYEYYVKDQDPEYFNQIVVLKDAVS